MPHFDSTSKNEKVAVFKGLVKDLPKMGQMRDPIKTLWNSDLTHEGESENEQLLTLINFSQLNDLFESFLAAIGLPVAIVDLKGAVLASSKWQRLCIEFHRANTGTLNHCIESDRCIYAQLEAGKDYASHQCSNGLIDCAAPIIIEGRHLANLFIGQFFVNPPDLDFFKHQQQQFGFDEIAYFEAISEVPVINEERLPAMMTLLAGWAQQIAARSLAENRALAALSSVERQVKERTEQLNQSHALLQTAQRAAQMGHYVTDLTAGTWINDALFDEIFGIDEQFPRDFANWQRLLHPDDIERVMARFEQAANNHESFPSAEYRITRPSDGALRWIAVWSHNFYDEEGNASLQVGMIQDITERKLMDIALQDSEQQLQLVLVGGYLGFWDWNIITNEVQRNAIWAEMLGYTHEEIQRTTQQWTDFIHPEDRDKAWQSINKVLEGQAAYHEVEYRMLHKDGSIVWILDHAGIVQRDTNGKPMRMSGTHTDISKQKRLEEQLRASENFFSSLAQVNPIGIYRTDAQGNCIYVNDIGCEIIGMTAQQAYGDGWSHAIFEDDRSKVYAEWMLAVAEQRKFMLEYRIQQPNGTIVWIYGLSAAIRDETGAVSGYVGTITDITERKNTEQHIHHLAFYDPLTQLANRRLLQECLKHSIELNRRTGNQMAVLMLDLDRFKTVNDTLGHAAGDELLQQVAKRIKDHLREMDMVARLGGDEFVVLIENVNHYEDIARIANDIIYALSQPFILRHNHEVVIGISIGIAIYPQHGDSVEALMDNADTALYHAKDNGRGCFAYFSEQLTQKARERLALEARLRRAIEQQELQLYFQPQIDINSGHIVGAEALIRWHDPVEGYIEPNSFIALAEETGLIVRLGEWALRETCRLGQQWLAQGLPAITLAVNVSPHQFHICDMNALVTDVLRDTGFPANSLELEITETGLMDNQLYAMTILNDLHQQGVHLAIDDFGTGYSSLAYLKYFPVDLLKIDKTFIDDIPFLQGDMAIAATIIAMAHHLGFKVLAEGVETPEQLAFLQQHQCDSYQGYLYSKPLMATDFAQLLLNMQVSLNTP